jgi:hypothetical protein
MNNILEKQKYRVRKQISDCQQLGHSDSRGHERTCEGDRRASQLDCGDDYIIICVAKG